MTVLSDRVDALEATNANLVSVLQGLQSTMQSQIAAGRGLVWQGEWATATAFTDVDAVSNDGQSYVCILGHTSSASTEPGVGASWQTYWDLLVSSGGKWRVDAGVPASSLGSDGDFYINTSNGDVYYKSGGAWSVQLNITGPKGDQGDGWTGATYDTGTGVVTFTSDDGLGFATGDIRGADGATWLTGSGAPASSLGSDGDLYLDTATGDYYTKSAGAWSQTGTLAGPKGDTGDGFTGGSYDAGTGTVTFTSDDGLGFATGDLRGADLDWRGAWVTATAYEVNDAVSSGGSSYVCISAHTSGGTTEPGVGASWQTEWDLMAAKGAAGAGTGDMLASTYDPQAIALDAFARANHTGTLAVADGGTGATTAAAARTGLGVEIGADVQAWDADLDAYATKTPPSGDVVGTTDTQTLTNKTIAGVPLSTQTADYTLVAADSGKWITVENSATVTIPDAVFAAGDVVRIYNSSANIIMLKCPITTARLGGVIGNQDNIMVPARGLATVLFLSATECVVSGDANENAPFEMSVQTTTASETFTIPAGNTGTFDATVDWGDGSTSSITAYNDADLTHTYTTAGTHFIKVTGLFPRIYFNDGGDKLKVRTVTLGNVGWQNLPNAFYGCSNMTIFRSGKTDTSSVTSMLYMFRNCSSVTTLDVSRFDTSSVTDMNRMFNDCSSVTMLDVSGFDTSSVTDMATMFWDCSSLSTLDVSGFDTSNVTSMSAMFRDCFSVTMLDVSGFDTSNVTSMSAMFRDCSSLSTLDVSSFDTSNVTSMWTMFFNCGTIDPTGIDGFDITSVTSLSSFASGSTFPTAKYDAILVGWEAQAVNDSLSPNFGNSTYTAASAAATARANLIADHSWTISDGGTA